MSSSTASSNSATANTIITNVSSSNNKPKKYHNLKQKFTTVPEQDLHENINVYKESIESDFDK